MKAIRIHQSGSFDQLKYEEVDPPVPGKNEVLIKVISASVNFADVMTRKGTYPMMPPLPAIPGVDCSGIVESVGENVSQLQPGQPVAALGQGCYADYMVTNPLAVFPISEDIDMDEAAAIPVNYLTAYHMMHTMAQIREGETILAYAAAGGVGTAVIQLAKLADVTVIGLTSMDEKANFAKAQGFHHILNYKTEDVVQKVKEITGGRGVELILNSVAGDTFSHDFEMLAPLGQIIWFGMAGGLPQTNLTEQLGAGFVTSVGVRTFMLPSIFDLDPTLMTRSSEILFNDLADKKIKPHIYERIPLSEAARAHELLESGKVQGKLILKP
ncbi:MAG: zinc-binding dehydrogenase [Desulfobacterales bacterium]|jgi:NADPH:quinone reductase-like Zn-dependent oxidoreductase